MAESITVARPYAKAIFEVAVEKKTLKRWANLLEILTQAIQTPSVIAFISNPAVTSEQKVDLLSSLVEKQLPSEEKKEVQNLLMVLASNKRLMLLSDIHVLYEFYRAEHEKTLAVDVISFSELSNTQLEKLSQSLSKRLSRQVSLNTSVDPSIMGGAIICAGDLVIDGSVRGQLDKLSHALAESI